MCPPPINDATKAPPFFKETPPTAQQYHPQYHESPPSSTWIRSNENNTQSAELRVPPQANCPHHGSEAQGPQVSSQSASQNETERGRTEGAFTAPSQFYIESTYPHSFDGVGQPRALSPHHSALLQGLGSYTAIEEHSFEPTRPQLALHASLDSQSARAAHIPQQPSASFDSPSTPRAARHPSSSTSSERDASLLEPSHTARRGAPQRRWPQPFLTSYISTAHAIYCTHREESEESGVEEATAEYESVLGSMASGTEKSVLETAGESRTFHTRPSTTEHPHLFYMKTGSYARQPLQNGSAMHSFEGVEGSPVTHFASYAPWTKHKAASPHEFHAPLASSLRDASQPATADKLYIEKIEMQERLPSILGPHEAKRPKDALSKQWTAAIPHVLGRQQQPLPPELPSAFQPHWDRENRLKKETTPVLPDYKAGYVYEGPRKHPPFRTGHRMVQPKGYRSIPEGNGKKKDRTGREVARVIPPGTLEMTRQKKGVLIQGAKQFRLPPVSFDAGMSAPPQRSQIEVLYSKSLLTEKAEGVTGNTRCAFGTLLLLCALSNFDHGAVPACLDAIGSDLHLGYIEQSLLGSLVYIGLVIGTIGSGALLQQQKAKTLLLISMVLFIGSVSGLAFLRWFPALCVARFLCGIAQALPTVYFPVWVDEFAPPEVTARWMSMTQIASILGTVSGYFLGGAATRIVPKVSELQRHAAQRWAARPTPPRRFLLWSHPSHTDGRLSELAPWHFPFLFQACLLLPTFISLTLVDTTALNLQCYKDVSGGEICTDDPSESIKRTRAQRSGIKASYKLLHRHPSSSSLLSLSPSVRSQLALLLGNFEYLALTLGMSNLYFVVTGVQFWVTQYLVDGLQYDKLTIVSLTTLCLLTSPTAGVCAGGWIADLSGGLHKARRQQAALIIVGLAGIASLCAIGATLTHRLTVFGPCLWFCLFTGAAIVPIAIGVMLSLVPLHLRPLSSAVSQILYNVFGWFAAPILSGLIMDTLSVLQLQPPLPLLWGFRFILLSSVVGFIFFLGAAMSISKDKQIGYSTAKKKCTRSDQLSRILYSPPFPHK